MGRDEEMIKTKFGKVEVDGNITEVYADLGCVLFWGFKNAFVPLFGRERAEKELYELVEDVLKKIDEEEE